MISAIILSAGESSRFGSPKALAKIKNDTVIKCLQNSLLNTLLDEIVIVLGAKAKEIEPELLVSKRIKMVTNKDYHLGQTSSFKVGLNSLSNKSKAVLMLPIDCPFVSEQTIAQMMTYFLDKYPLILIPTYQGRGGHPPIFSTKLKNDFLHLKNDVGINTITHRHKKDTIIFPVKDSGVVKSFNTKEEFEQIKKELNLT